MSPTQIANLEATFLERARACKSDGDFIGAATWQAAAALLIEAAGKKPTRRKFKPLDLTKIQG